MEDNGDHYLCGICKAGFQSSAFLPFMEHMVRHFSVFRNNKCPICHKGFARTPTLKEHLLHFHAIPLKINSEGQLQTDMVNAFGGHGSARCSWFNKQEISEDKTKSFASNALIQGQVANVLCCIDGSSNIPSSCSTSKIIAQEGTDNSNAFVDVLSFTDDINVMNTVDQVSVNVVNPDQNGDINSGSKLRQELDRPYSTYSEVSSLPFVSNAVNVKDLNPNLFLMDPTTSETTREIPSPVEINVSSGGEGVSQIQINGSSHKVSYGENSTTGNESLHLTNIEVNMNLPSVNVETCESNMLHSQNLSHHHAMKTQHHILNEQISVPSQSIMVSNFEATPHFNQIDDKAKTQIPSRRAKQAHKSKELTSNHSNNSVGNSTSTVNNQTVGKDHGNSIDFHFFLGNTVIHGSSMTYNRLEFRCLHCAFVCAWRPSLVRHMKQMHKDTLDFHKILDIKNIQSKFECDEKLRKYKVMKNSDYILANSKVRNRKRMVRNVERQDIPGKYSCPVCFKVFRKIRYMRRHQMTHTSERSHLCDTCGKSFKTRANFLAHRQSHKSRSYHCPQCDFVSSLTNAIHRHRQIHPNGSVVCDICGTAYIDKSTLKKHYRVHDISRPFPCTFPGCTWRFKTEGMRKAHIQTHTTEGKFQCHHCGYRFRHKHHLQRHLSKIHSQPQTSATITSKVHADTVLSTSLDQGIMGSTVFIPSADDLMKNTTNITYSSTTTTSNSHEILLSSVSDDIPPSNNIPSPPGVELKQPQTSVNLFVGDKPLEVTVDTEDKALESSVSVGLEHSLDSIPMSSLSNLEYITDNGEILQVVKPGQVYMRQDQCGNVVEYRITDFRTEDENQSQSQPVYVIRADGSIVAAGSQDQALLLP